MTDHAQSSTWSIGQTQTTAQTGGQTNTAAASSQRIQTRSNAIELTQSSSQDTEQTRTGTQSTQHANVVTQSTNSVLTDTLVTQQTNTGRKSTGQQQPVTQSTYQTDQPQTSLDSTQRPTQLFVPSSQTSQATSRAGQTEGLTTAVQNPLIGDDDGISEIEEGRKRHIPVLMLAHRFDLVELPYYFPL